MASASSPVPHDGRLFRPLGTRTAKISSKLASERKCGGAESFAELHSRCVPVLAKPDANAGGVHGEARWAERI